MLYLKDLDSYDLGVFIFIFSAIFFTAFWWLTRMTTNIEMLFLFFVIISCFLFLIRAGLNITERLKKRNMTVLDELCADVPRCFNISIGNKEIAKRIMLDAHKRNKRFIEKHFDEWVVLCVRDKLIK